MSILLKILFTILAVLYVISPYDILPDVMPVLGQTDDLFILGALFYYIWRGKWPVLKRGKTTGMGNRQENKQRPTQDEAGTTTTDPYEILGVKKGAAPDEIRDAYRKISQKYHPDKVIHLGDEFQELAEKKFVEINNAYQWIREKEGW